VDIAAYVGLFIGTVLYARFLIHVPFRQVFFWTQVVAVLMSALDLVQVFRLNVKVGLPDAMFVLTSDVMIEVLGRFSTMPFLVVAAQICPEFIEATLFAVLMSLSNLSTDVGTMFGSFFLHYYGVTDSNFDNLWKCIVWRTALGIIPLFFVFLLPNSNHVEPPKLDSMSFMEKKDKDSEKNSPLDNQLDDEWSNPNDTREDLRLASQEELEMEHLHDAVTHAPPTTPNMHCL